MVNPPKSPPSGTGNAAWQDECYCSDNWGVWSGNATPCVSTPNYNTAPVVYKQVYQGVCAAGSHVQWSYMAYQATTPSDSNVVFQAHTANTIAGLALPVSKTLATAKATPAPDTQKMRHGWTGALSD